MPRGFSIGHPLLIAPIETFALLCQEHEKPLTLIDSYGKVIAPLGIDEFKPDFASPIYDLMSAVAPYEATVVLIHHSSKIRQVIGHRMLQEQVMAHRRCGSLCQSEVPLG